MVISVINRNFGANFYSSTLTNNTHIQFLFTYLDFADFVPVFLSPVVAIL